jgi:hypothetical protein
MPRREPESTPAPPPTLPPPLGNTRWKRISLDATDWRMYCDRLQDANAPESEWQRAKHIADSLAQDAKLVLIKFCQAEFLGDRRHTNHWLRVGETWFIGAPATVIDSSSSHLVWWRRSWVLEGFVRYPSSDPDRNEEKLIGLNYGTPWKLPHPSWPKVRRKKKQMHETLIERFFDAHALVAIPQEYL